MSEPDALAAALLRLSEHADHLARLEERETRHAAEAADRITALTTLADAMRHTLDDQAEVLAGLKDLDDQVASLAARIDDVAPADDSSGAAIGPRPRRVSGSSTALRGMRRSSGCALGSSTSTCPATVTSPRRWATAGSSIRCACTRWTG